MNRKRIMVSFLLAFVMLLSACNFGNTPQKTLDSIVATYTQGTTVVYSSDSVTSNKITDYLVVRAQYSDNTSQVLSANAYTLSGELTPGTAEVTVTLNADTSKTTKFNVQVTEVTFTQIEATFTQGTLGIYTSDSVTAQKILDKLVVVATQGDGSTVTLEPSEYTLTGTITAGTSTITVTLNSDSTLTDTFTVTVSDVAIASISATFTQGTTKIYPSDLANSQKIKEKLVVTAHYNDGTQSTLSADQYIVSGTLTAGNRVLTVKLLADQSKSTTFNVTVSAVAVVSISAEYTQGTTVVYTSDDLQKLKGGLEVTAQRSDGTQTMLDDEDYTLSGNISSAGTKTITVKLNSDATISDTFTAVVTAVAPVSISAIYSGSLVTLGTALNELKSDLLVRLHYNNSTTTTIPNANYSLSGSLIVGERTITVTYTADPTKTTTFTVNVFDGNVKSVSTAINESNGAVIDVVGVIVAFGPQISIGLGSGDTAGAQRGLVITDGANILNVSDLGVGYRKDSTFKEYVLDKDTANERELVLGDEILLGDVKLAKTSTHLALTFATTSSINLVNTNKLVSMDWTIQPEITITNEAELEAFADAYKGNATKGGRLIKFVGTNLNPFYLCGANETLDSMNLVLHYNREPSNSDADIKYQDRRMGFKVRANEFNMGAEFWNTRFDMGLESGKGVVSPSATIPSTKWAYTGEIYAVLFNVSTSFYNMTLIDLPSTNIQKPTVNLTVTHDTVMKYDMDSRHALDYYIFDTGVPGKNVAIIGGVHGNEVAGWGAALNIIENFNYSKGKFLIIPKANKLACDLNDRYPGGKSPGNYSNDTKNYTKEMGYTDMNREFPGNPSGTITQQITAVITEILDAFQPQIIFDLHESQNTYNGAGQLGNSVISKTSIINGSINTKTARDAVIRAINSTDLVLLDPATNSLDRKEFVSLGASTLGMVSTTYSERYGAPTFTTETTRYEGINPEITVVLSKRIEQQRFLIDFLLNYYGAL